MDPIIDINQIQTSLTNLLNDVNALNAANTTQVAILQKKIDDLTYQSQLDAATIASLRAEIANLNNPPVVNPPIPPVVGLPVCPPVVAGSTMIDWDNVVTFPKNMSWDVNGNYNNPPMENSRPRQFMNSMIDVLHSNQLL